MSVCSSCGLTPQYFCLETEGAGGHTSACCNTGGQPRPAILLSSSVGTAHAKYFTSSVPSPEPPCQLGACAAIAGARHCTWPSCCAPVAIAVPPSVPWRSLYRSHPARPWRLCPGKYPFLGSHQLVIGENLLPSPALILVVWEACSSHYVLTCTVCR